MLWAILSHNFFSSSNIYIVYTYELYIVCSEMLTAALKNNKLAKQEFPVNISII